MKKVIFSVTKLGKVENTKVTGVGYITDEDLITANIGKSGKPYIRIGGACLCLNRICYEICREVFKLHYFHVFFLLDFFYIFNMCFLRKKTLK